MRPTCASATCTWSCASKSWRRNEDPNPYPIVLAPATALVPVHRPAGAAASLLFLQRQPGRQCALLRTLGEGVHRPLRRGLRMNDRQVDRIVDAIGAAASSLSWVTVWL